MLTLIVGTFQLFRPAVIWRTTGMAGHGKRSLYWLVAERAPGEEDAAEQN